jgi:hypothetical protein
MGCVNPPHSSYNGPPNNKIQSMIQSAAQCNVNVFQLMVYRVKQSKINASNKGSYLEPNIVVVIAQLYIAVHTLTLNHQ